MSEDEAVVYLVVGVNTYPEDGFSIAKAFENEDEAEEYAENGEPWTDVRHGHERYYVKEVPYV